MFHQLYVGCRVPFPLYVEIINVHPIRVDFLTPPDASLISCKTVRVVIDFANRDVPSSCEIVPHSIVPRSYLFLPRLEKDEACYGIIGDLPIDLCRTWVPSMFKGLRSTTTFLISSSRTWGRRHILLFLLPLTQVWLHTGVLLVLLVLLLLEKKNGGTT